MQTDRFTIKAVEAMQQAERAAQSLGHAELTPVHVLAALVRSERGDENGDAGGIVVPILHKAGARLDQIRSICESELGRLPKVSGATLTPSRALTEVLRKADAEAERMKDRYLSTEHLLIALADVASGAKEILTVSGAGKDAILAALKDVRGNASVTSQNPEDTYQSLERYGRDLVAMARQGKLESGGSAVMRRFGGSCRCWRGGPRTTRC